jgi:hypothetical protein
MAKFNLKEHIAKNKATFFGSLTEGQFSWMTQDTGQQIGSQDENQIPVYMFDDKGKYYYENDYEGYGVFGGKDYYELLDQMNGGSGDRERGIDLAFGKEKTGNEILFPALVTSPSNFNYKNHDFTKEPESDPNQSWYEPEEDDFYDQNDEEVFGDMDKEEDYDYSDEEELDEVKTTNTKMKKSEFKDKIKEMILKEINLDIDNMEDAPESEVDFLAELEGMLDEAEGLTPLQDYVYQYEIEISGEDRAQEFLDDIKQLATPQDVYDYYAYERDLEGSDLNNIFRQVKRKFASSNTANDLTPLQKQAYSYAKERFGFEDAKNSLDQIKTLTTREEFSDWVQKKIKDEKGLNEANEFEINKPARIAAFIKDLDALIDEYHAELYLFGGVLDAIEMVKKVAQEEIDMLNEAKGDEEVTDDVTTDDVAVDDTETIDTTTTTEVNPDVKAVQDSLTQAQAAAQKLGDPKLTDQIGNTITFFTRNHVVEKGAVAEVKEMEEAMIPIEPGDSDYDIGYKTFFVYEDRIGGFDIENIKKVGMVLANKIKNDNKIKNTDEFFRGFMDSWNESSDSTADKEDMYEAKKPVNEVMFPMLKKILK